MARTCVPSINEPRFSGFILSDSSSFGLLAISWFAPLPIQELTVSLPFWKTQLTASLSSSFADCVAKLGFLFTSHLGLQELTASLLTSHTQLTASLSDTSADCVAGSSSSSSESWDRYRVSKPRLFCHLRVMWPRPRSLPWDGFPKRHLCYPTACVHISRNDTHAIQQLMYVLYFSSWLFLLIL